MVFDILTRRKTAVIPKPHDLDLALHSPLHTTVKNYVLSYTESTDFHSHCRESDPDSPSVRLAVIAFLRKVLRGGNPQDRTFALLYLLLRYFTHTSFRRTEPYISSFQGALPTAWFSHFGDSSIPYKI